MKINQFYRVQQLEHTNQFVIFADDKIIFQSYDSTIAVFDKYTKELTLGYNWDYSYTTLKHLYVFLKRWCYEIRNNNDIYDLDTLLLNTKGKSNRVKIKKLIDDGFIGYDEEM